MGKHLKIPKKKKSTGEFIFCTKCNTNVKYKCKKSGKRISTCKFSNQQHFKAAYHVKGTKSTTISRLFNTRDYDEFKEKKVEFFKTLDRLDVSIENVQEVKEQLGIVKKIKADDKRFKTIELQNKLVSNKLAKPTSLKAVVQMYLDYMADVDVPVYKKKNYSKSYIDDLLIAFTNFATAIKEELELNPKTILITEIGEKEVGAFHTWLENALNEKGEKRFGNRSYNKSMAYMRKLFRYLNDKRNYEIKDPFIGVKEKETFADPTSLSFDEFDLLLKQVTPAKGKFMKKDRGKEYPNTHYKDWMKNAFKLALETGERRDGLAFMRWSDIQMNKGVIAIKNHKVSNIQNKTVIRRIPITISLRKLLNSMKFKAHIGSNNFILAPEIKARKTVMNWMSRAFSHFWKLTGEEAVYSFKHLRKTYVTTIVGALGDDATKVTGQTIDNIVKNYLDKEVILATATSFDLRKLNEKLRKKIK